MRRVRALVLGGAVALGVFGAFPTTRIAAQSAPKPSVELSSHTLEPGTTVAIGGAHWPEGSTLQAALCGNRALDGSANCVPDTAVTMKPGPDGVIVSTLPVTIPPAPCPCVVFVNLLASDLQFRLPVKVLGAPVAPLERHLPSRATNNITTRATVESTTSVGALFGGDADRTLVVELHNTSDVALHRIPVVAAWGKDDADHPIPSRSVTLPPHGTVTVRLPFELDPVSVGSYDVAGTAGIAGNQAAFTSHTSQWPWGLLAILVLVGVGIVVLVIRALRRRHRARKDSVVAPVEEIDLTRVEEPESIWLEEPEPIWLEEPEPIWLDEPEPIWLDEPESIWLEEPEPIWLDEPEPISWNWISWNPDRDERAGAADGSRTPTRW